MMYDRIKTVMLNLVLLCTIGFAVAACSSSSEDEPETKPSVPLTVASQSIKDGDEVSVNTTSMTIEYSHPVALGASANIKLNDNTIVPTVSNKTITIALSLTEGTSYTLSIPSGAIVRKDDASVKAAALTVNFKTPDPIKPGNIDALTNANATTQAKNVYNFLLTQYGKKTLSGAMANVNNNNEFADLIYSTAKKHPALTGYDFIHLPYSPANWIDYSNITPAKTQWDNNGLVTYMWHWLVPPTQGAAINDYSFEANKGFDIREALKEGTWQHDFILKDIEKVAGYLKLLQDAGIAVLWRPLHEAAGHYDQYGRENNAWFWWGDKGVEYTKQLWILLHDKLVKDCKLNNLIWVWTVQIADGYESQALAAYPGDEYVDIVGTDIYAADIDSKLTQFNFINNNVTRGKKMITLAECGNIPNPAKCFAAGDTWSWFMVWYTQKDGKLQLTDTTDKNFNLNTASYWMSVLGNANIISREDMPSLK